MTKKTADKNINSNTALDRFFMGVSAGTILVLAWHEVLRHIQAARPVNYGFAAVAIGFLLYMVIAPIYRKR